MKVVELRGKEALLKVYGLLTELYSDMSFEEYEHQLREMLQQNYFMLAVYSNDELVALSGVWIGQKLWCGKYMELDNVVVTQSSRSKGVGAFLFDYAKKYAKKEGCASIGLDSFTYNHASHKFFFKEDFVAKGYHFVHMIDPSKMR